MMLQDCPSAFPFRDKVQIIADEGKVVRTIGLFSFHNQKMQQPDKHLGLKVMDKILAGLILQAVFQDSIDEVVFLLHEIEIRPLICESDPFPEHHLDSLDEITVHLRNRQLIQKEIQPAFVARYQFLENRAIKFFRDRI